MQFDSFSDTGGVHSVPAKLDKTWGQIDCGYMVTEPSELDRVSACGAPDFENGSAWREVCAQVAHRHFKLYRMTVQSICFE